MDGHQLEPLVLADVSTLVARRARLPKTLELGTQSGAIFGGGDSLERLLDLDELLLVTARSVGMVSTAERPVLGADFSVTQTGVAVQYKVGIKDVHFKPLSFL